MKFTLSWLKDHLKTKATVDEIASKLSAIGLEVESVDNPAESLGAFRVARIVEAGKHPNADKLQVIQVEVEKGAPLLEVVCGAPNARAGLIGVFAPLGTYIPGLEDHAREEARARRRVERHDVLGGRARAFRGSRGHHRAAGRHGGSCRRALRGRCGSRRPGV